MNGRKHGRQESYQPVTGPTEVNHLAKIPYGCDCHNFAPHFGFAYRLPDEWSVAPKALKTRSMNPSKF